MNPRVASGVRAPSAFQLVEVLVALVILSGPLLLVVQLIQSNSAGARFNRQQATARLVLLDLATLLSGETADGLRDKLQPGQGWKLYDLLDRRIARMPEPARGPYREQVQGIAGDITGSLEEAIDPAAPGLARLTLRAMLGPGRQVTVSTLLRPAARMRLLNVQPIGSMRQGKKQ